MIISLYFTPWFFVVHCMNYLYSTTCDSLKKMSIKLSSFRSKEESIDGWQPIFIFCYINSPTCSLFSTSLEIIRNMMQRIFDPASDMISKIYYHSPMHHLLRRLSHGEWVFADIIANTCLLLEQMYITKSSPCCVYVNLAVRFSRTGIQLPFHPSPSSRISYCLGMGLWDSSPGYHRIYFSKLKKVIAVTNCISTPSIYHWVYLHS